MTMPDPDALLSAYDTHLRGAPEILDAAWHDRDGPLLRAIFDDTGFVTTLPLTTYDVQDLDGMITRTIDFFARDTDVTQFEWKTRGHDHPAELMDRLTAHGLVAGETETVMIGEAALLTAWDPPEGITLRKMSDGQPGLGDRVEHWVAQDPAGTVVTRGRLEFVPGTEFAGLWGGSTMPEWRRRGIYRALTSARARSAVARGVRYLHSDCSSASRPILERAGLVAVTTTTPYIWSRGT